jgi:hypothetical protein
MMRAFLRLSQAPALADSRMTAPGRELRFSAELPAINRL